MSQVLAMAMLAGVGFLLFYVHAGYPLLMYFLARRWPRPLASRKEDGGSPRFSVLLCVHNESARLTSRLKNLQSLQWPGPVEIIVVCDGCTDDTVMVARAVGPEVIVLEQAVKSGKPAGLNIAAQRASGDILIFCDARQTFAPDAIQELALPFADASVGAVSGSLEIAGSEAGGGQGVDLYWKLEKKLREWEGRFSSVVGCTGAIYALRRDLYLPIPNDTLLDDVVIPMQAVMQGSRVLFAPTAVAFDPQHLDPELEARRKLRTLVGNYQMLVRHPQWLVPGKCPIWWQVISHKYLRLAVPWLLAAFFALSLLLSVWHSVFIVLTLLQLVCYSLGLAGMFFKGLRHKAVSIPAGFLVLQWANLRALFAWLGSLKDPNALWQNKR